MRLGRLVCIARPKFKVEGALVPGGRHGAFVEYWTLRVKINTLRQQGICFELQSAKPIPSTIELNEPSGTN
jgi:hypothetical protein